MQALYSSLENSVNINSIGGNGKDSCLNKEISGSGGFIYVLLVIALVVFLLRVIRREA